MRTGQMERKPIELGEITERAVVIGIRSGRGNRSDAEESMDELCALVRAAGAEIGDCVFCDLDRIRAGTYIGSGKVAAVAEIIREKAIDIAVVDVALSPPQQRNLERAWNIRVIDRTGIILDIFANRAATREGKLQVELAQLEYRLPRLTRMWEHLGRLGAGIGTRGPGETQLEVDRRRIRARLDKLRSGIEKIKNRRRLHRKGRQKTGIPTVAIVGYTNAGKSTLLNRLTGAGVTVKDQLFATLDPTLRQLTLPNQKTVILSDTVGFISRLPHELVAAFHATLEEVTEADLLLHVVDSSSERMDEQMNDVLAVLKELKADHKPVFTVYNKIDRADGWVPGVVPCGEHAFAISALNGDGIPDLLAGLADYQSRHAAFAVFRIPYTESAVAAQIRNHCEVVDEVFEARDIVLSARADRALINKFHNYLDPESHTLDDNV